MNSKVTSYLQCENCGEHIITCDQCYKEFEEYDLVVCIKGMHFCSGECAVDYREAHGIKMEDYE